MITANNTISYFGFNFDRKSTYYLANAIGLIQILEVFNVSESKTTTIVAKIA